MAERPMEHFTVDGVNIFEVTDAKARQDCSDLKDDFDSLETTLATKADKDGSYDDLTSGNAKQLVSTVYTDDSTPYLFRTTGGSADVGDREYVDAVVGGTVAWNQLVQNGNFADTSGWNGRLATVSIADGVATMTPTSDGAQRGLFSTSNGTTKANHKYFLHVFAKPAVDCRLDMSINGANSKYVSMTANVWNDCGAIWTTASDYNTRMLYMLIAESLTTSQSVQYKTASIIDLTQLFGTTIADYIYGLETANAGAGVAWFKKLFPKPYYAYNAGSLQSVQTSEHKMVGFNQWDEEVLSGYYSSSGVYSSANNQLCTKNKIQVIPSSTYCLRVPFSSGYNSLGVCEYDANEAFIQRLSLDNYSYSVGYILYTPSANCHYITVNFGTPYGTTYNHDICINLSWDGEKDGQYEPYVEHTYPLDADVVLRGIPKLDAQNNLYYDGDEYTPDGAVNRRYGITDLGTLNWTGYDASLKRSYASLSDVRIVNGPVVANILPSKLLTPISVASFDADITVDCTICVNNGSAVLWCRLLSATSAVEYKSMLSGVYLLYELAEPTTETAEPYQQTQICDDFGTEEYVSTSPVPVGHNTRYAPNLRAKLEMSPDSPDGDGVYVVQQSNGENTYVSLGSTTVIQNILARLTALENA